MVKVCRRRVYPWSAALLLAVFTAGPAGALVIAIGQPTHQCHCPAHVSAPLQEPIFGPCGEEAKAVAASAPSALPGRAAAMRFVPTGARVAVVTGGIPESRLPLPETPPPRSPHA